MTAKTTCTTGMLNMMTTLTVTNPQTMSRWSLDNNNNDDDDDDLLPASNIKDAKRMIIAPIAKRIVTPTS